MTGVFLFFGIYGLGAVLTHIGCTALNVPEDEAFDCEATRNLSSIFWFFVVPGYFGITYGQKLYIKVLTLLDNVGYKLREKLKERK